MRPSISRGRALKSIAAVPIAALAAGAAASAAAKPTATKAQLKYQDKPGPKGQKCAGCRLFRPPHACTFVQGTISPKGWCLAYTDK